MRGSSGSSRRTIRRAFAALPLILAASSCSTSPPPPARAVASRSPVEPAASRLAELTPEGFSRSGPPLRYGTEARPLENGTIFDYIDGAGVAYLEHGFTDVLHVEYGDREKNTVTLDVYRMSTAGQAREALADERICPPGAEALGLDPAGKSYRYPPDYFFYFVHGRSLVCVRVSDDRLSDRVTRFGATVKSTLEQEEP